MSHTATKLQFCHILTAHQSKCWEFKWWKTSDLHSLNYPMAKNIPSLVACHGMVIRASCQRRKNIGPCFITAPSREPQRGPNEAESSTASNNRGIGLLH